MEPSPVKKEVGILIQDECKTCALKDCSDCLLLSKALEGKRYHEVWDQSKVDGFTCEVCGVEIPPGKEKRLEDGDVILCETCDKRTNHDLTGI